MVRSNVSPLALLLVASLGAVACKAEEIGDAGTEAYLSRTGLNDHSHRVPDAALAMVRSQLEALDFSRFSPSSGQACHEPANKSAQAYAIHWHKTATDSSGRTIARAASTYAGASVVEPASVYAMSVKANGQVLENGRVARSYKWSAYNVVQRGKRIATDIQNRRGPMVSAESAGEYFTFGTENRGGETFHYLASSECNGLCGVFAKGSDTLQLVNGACWGIHMDAQLHADMKANKPLTKPGLSGEAQSYQALRYNALTLFLMPWSSNGNGGSPIQQSPGNVQKGPTNEQQRPPGNQQQAPSNSQWVPVNTQQAPVNTQQAPSNTQWVPVNTQQAPVNPTQQSQSGSTTQMRTPPTFAK